MLLRISLLAAMLVALAACGQSTGDPNVAAVVNGSPISLEQVERRMEVAMADPQVQQQLADDAGGEVRRQVQAQVVQQLIQAELLEQGADELGVEVTEADVAETRTEIVERFGGEEEFAAFLEEQQLAEAEVQAQLRDLTVQQQIEERLTADLDVTEDQLRAFYEENLESRYEQAEARHILVESEEEANAALERLRAGEDFAEVAADVSTDGSAEQGGDLGTLRRGDTVPEFDEVVFTAPLGEVQGPVQTQFGFHLIEVTSRETSSFEDVREEIREELLQSDRMQAVQGWLQERIEQAEVTVNPRFGRWDATTGGVVAEDPLGALRTEAPADPGLGGLPGGQPGAPGGQPGAPGGQPGAPGGQPGAPGGQPGAPAEELPADQPAG